MSIETPIPDGTSLAFISINGVQYPLNIITDAAGNDAIGIVSSPASGTILGLLTAILAAQIQANSYLAQIAGTSFATGSTDFHQDGNPILGAVS